MLFPIVQESLGCSPCCIAAVKSSEETQYCFVKKNAGVRCKAAHPYEDYTQLCPLQLTGDALQATSGKRFTFLIRLENYEELLYCFEHTAVCNAPGLLCRMVPQRSTLSAPNTPILDAEEPPIVFLWFDICGANTRWPSRALCDYKKQKYPRHEKWWGASKPKSAPDETAWFDQNLMLDYLPLRRRKWLETIKKNINDAYQIKTTNYGVCWPKNGSSLGAQIALKKQYNKWLFRSFLAQDHSVGEVLNIGGMFSKYYHTLVGWFLEEVTLD